MHTRWKKNTAGMLAAGHPECRYVATVCASYAVEMMNKVRRALTIGGPTFIHSLDPCPKGWDYDPMLSHELGELAVETGIFPLYEVEDGVVRHYGKTKAIVEGRPRKARARIPAQAGALRPLHGRGPRVLPGQGGRDVGQVGDPGRDSVLEGEAPGSRRPGHAATAGLGLEPGRRELWPGPYPRPALAA